MYEQISQDTLKDLFKIWKVKNAEDLETKSSNVSIVSFKFFSLSKEAKNIILYILKNEDKELNSIDIAYSLKYTQKQIPVFFNYIEDIKKSGLLYLKIKRRRLNSHDDTLYFLPNVKPIIESLLLKDNIKISNYTDYSYTANAYKKYLQKIIYIYENGNIVEYNKSKLDDDELFALCKANIVSVYFYGNELKPYIDENYPTKADRNHTYIGGSSMGGLMSLYMIIKHSDIFSKAACVSCHIYPLFKKMRKDIRTKMHPNTTVYISWGGREYGNNHILATVTDQNLQIVRALLKKPHVKVIPYVFKNHDHSESSWRKELPMWFKELKL